MNDHSGVTRLAIDALPAWQREIWAPEAPGMIDDYCFYPDHYYSEARHEEVREYQPLFAGPDGGKPVPFHYPPPSFVNTSTWEMVAHDGGFRLEKIAEPSNANWRHVRAGLEYYAREASEALAAGNLPRAARLAGVLLHFFQDSGSGIHSVEGADGMDIYALDRLVAAAPDTPFRPPTVILAEPDVVPETLGGYHPRLRAAEPGEAAFRLYSDYWDLVRGARLRLLPIVRSDMAGDRAAADRHRSILAENTARLCADVLYTVTCMGTGRFEPDELAALGKLDLTTTKPAREPRYLSGPYRFTPMIAGSGLDADHRAVPLELLTEDGPQTFERGWGTGCHVEYTISWELPPGVYDRFECTAGLHARLGREGHVAIRADFAGQTMFDRTFRGPDQAARVTIPVEAGGQLDLWAFDRTGNWSNPANHLVWAAPRLTRTAP